MNCVDLFCGCGGLSLGFLQAGYKIVLGIDSWEKALNIYKKTFPIKYYKKILRMRKELFLW